MTETKKRQGRISWMNLLFATSLQPLFILILITTTAIFASKNQTIPTSNTAIKQNETTQEKFERLKAARFAEASEIKNKDTLSTRALWIIWVTVAVAAFYPLVFLIAWLRTGAGMTLSERFETGVHRLGHFAGIILAVIFVYCLMNGLWEGFLNRFFGGDEERLRLMVFSALFPSIATIGFFTGLIGTRMIFWVFDGFWKRA